MERITKELPAEANTSELLRILRGELAVLNAADFTPCRLRHEKLVPQPDGTMKAKGSILPFPEMCPAKVRENRPACPHHYDSARMPAIPHILNAIKHVAHPRIELHIQQLIDNCREIGHSLLELDTRRNSLSCTEFALRATGFVREPTRLSLAEEARAIDQEYDRLLTETKRIHTETRALLQQVIDELSATPLAESREQALELQAA